MTRRGISFIILGVDNASGYSPAVPRRRRKRPPERRPAGRTQEAPREGGVVPWPGGGARVSEKDISGEYFFVEWDIGFKFTISSITVGYML